MKKICKRCNIEKEEESFYKDKKSKNGHRSICKLCEKERHKKFAKEKWKKDSSNRNISYWNTRANKLRLRSNGNVTGIELEQLVKSSGEKCTYCGNKTKKFHFDHKISVCHGGLSNINNIQILCPECNKFKKSFDHDYFIKMIRKIAGNLK